MIISAIAAVSENGVIGKDNDLPWRMPDDLRYFMRTTKGHHVIMGRRNFQSLERPLRNRTNIVLSRNPFFLATDVYVYPSLEEALAFCEENGEEEVFVIGGAEIYELAKPFLNRLYLTRIHAEVEGDVFFPEMDLAEYRLTKEEKHLADDRNPYDYTYLVYERIDSHEQTNT